MGHECRQPAMFFRQRDLPVARACVERADELSFADTAQHFVDGRHRVSVIDSKQVQISIVTGNANTTVFLGHTHDRTRHRTVRRSYQSFVEQVVDLAVDLWLECVWYTVGTHLPRHKPVGGLDSMHHCVASSGSVVELNREFVEQLAGEVVVVDRAAGARSGRPRLADCATNNST